MSTDPTPTASPGIAQADRLYKSFPVFSDWGELSASDVDLWDRFAANLNERRQSATPEALKSAVEVAIRAAALDTGAIEGLYDVDRGFTMTVALQTLAWEQAIEERGAGVRELFEAQLEAYEPVLDAVTPKLPITEAWIRALHEKLCAPQKTYRVLTDLGWQEQELPKGQYKTHPNHVRLSDGTLHAYAPVDRVPDEMHRFLVQIRSPEFEAAHPILQASYCHYALVVIHPFADGNGRVARALASIFFYRAQSIPLVIFANQLLAYYESLHAADLGDCRQVILFFRDRGIDTMQLVAESLMTAEVPSPEIAALRVKELLYPGRDLSLEALDSIAIRLLNNIEERVKSLFKSLELPQTLSLEVGSGEDGNSALPGYRMTNRKALSLIRIKTSSVVRAIAYAFVRVLVAVNQSDPFKLLVEEIGSHDNLEVRLDDVYPEMSKTLDLRLVGWTGRLLGRLLTSADKQSMDSLRNLQ